MRDAFIELTQTVVLRGRLSLPRDGAMACDPHTLHAHKAIHPVIANIERTVFSKWMPASMREASVSSLKKQVFYLWSLQ